MKLPVDLNGIALAKRLCAFGYQITRQTGSHMRLTRQAADGQQHITIPAHIPLKVGTLRQILKDVAQHCDIPIEELLKQLET